MATFVIRERSNGWPGTKGGPPVPEIDGKATRVRWTPQGNTAPVIAELGSYFGPPRTTGRTTVAEIIGRPTCSETVDYSIDSQDPGKTAMAAQLVLGPPG